MMTSFSIVHARRKKRPGAGTHFRRAKTSRSQSRLVRTPEFEPSERRRCWRLEIAPLHPRGRFRGYRRRRWAPARITSLQTPGLGAGLHEKGFPFCATHTRGGQWAVESQASWVAAREALSIRSDACQWTELGIADSACPGSEQKVHKPRHHIAWVGI